MPRCLHSQPRDEVDGQVYVNLWGVCSVENVDTHSGPVRWGCPKAWDEDLDKTAPRLCPGVLPGVLPGAGGREADLEQWWGEASALKQAGAPRAVRQRKAQMAGVEGRGAVPSGSPGETPGGLCAPRFLCHLLLYQMWKLGLGKNSYSFEINNNKLMLT